MVEVLLMLGMLAFVYLLLLQSRHLTDRKRAKRRSIGFFQFKLNIDRAEQVRNGEPNRKKG